MKLKAQHVMDATLVISQIIRDQRGMPQKGKYRLARMHAKLLGDFNTLTERRDAMIRDYDTPQMVPAPIGEDNPLGDKMVPSGNFMVPEDKVSEFNAAWKEVGDQMIEIADLEPIPLAQLTLADDTNGCIEAHELIVLGDLVTE